MIYEGFILELFILVLAFYSYCGYKKWNKDFFHSHLICTVFCLKCNTGLKWVMTRQICRGLVRPSSSDHVNLRKCYDSMATRTAVTKLGLQEDSGVLQTQPSTGVLRKRCSENMQQIYIRTPMPKYNFNKVALQLYWNYTSAWVFSSKLRAYFQNFFF